MWRFKGSPHYLDEQARRLGITQVLADRARSNTEIYHIAVLLAQVAERYHKARQENGMPVIYMTERAQIKGTLEQCELDLQKLHMLAAAADAMLSEAWEAFGFPTPRRIFEVHSATDTPVLPLGDGTVGIGDDQPEVFAQSL